MNRLRTAVIFGTLSLAVYFFAAGLTAMISGGSTISHEVLLPFSLLESLFRESLGQSDIARDLPVVSSLWLALVCIVDLSVLLSSVKLMDIVRIHTNSVVHIRRLLTNLHLVESKH